MKTEIDKKGRIIFYPERVWEEGRRAKRGREKDFERERDTEREESEKRES